VETGCVKVQTGGIGVGRLDERAAVPGDRNGVGLPRRWRSAGAGELGALLRPLAIAAREDPESSSELVVAWATDDGGVPVGGKGDVALLRRPDGFGADELGALLAPG
jgi:hypothetical protein